MSRLRITDSLGDSAVRFLQITGLRPSAWGKTGFMDKKVAVRFIGWGLIGNGIHTYETEDVGQYFTGE